MIKINNSLLWEPITFESKVLRHKITTKRNPKGNSLYLEYSSGWRGERILFGTYESSRTVTLSKQIITDAVIETGVLLLLLEKTHTFLYEGGRLL